MDKAGAQEGEWSPVDEPAGVPHGDDPDVGEDVESGADEDVEPGPAPDACTEDDCAGVPEPAPAGAPPPEPLPPGDWATAVVEAPLEDPELESDVPPEDELPVNAGSSAGGRTMRGWQKSAMTLGPATEMLMVASAFEVAVAPARLNGPTMTPSLVSWAISA